MTPQLISQGVEIKVEETTKVPRKKEQREQSQGGQKTGHEICTSRELGVPGIWIKIRTGEKQEKSAGSSSYLVREPTLSLVGHGEPQKSFEQSGAMDRFLFNGDLSGT